MGQDGRCGAFHSDVLALGRLEGEHESSIYGSNGDSWGHVALAPVFVAVLFSLVLSTLAPLHLGEKGVVSAWLALVGAVARTDLARAGP